MKTAIVTGATGFIGVHLIRELLGEGMEVYAVLRPNSVNATRIPADKKVHTIELNMDEYHKLPALIQGADYFYHLAWEGARAPFRDDALVQEKNYFCAVEAFKIAKRLGCSFFLGSGSQAEYGITTGLVNEDYPCMPINAYGREKLHTYTTLSRMAEEAKIHFIWTRIFSIYGPYDYSGTLVMQCVDKMKKNEPVKMTAGTQLWDYLYVADAARAMRMLADSTCESGVYIVASGDYKPLYQYVEEIKTVLNSQSELCFGAVPYGPSGPVNLMPDPSKLRRALNWMPGTCFADGIREILKTEQTKHS